MARLALISVSDKTDVVDLAHQLVKQYGFDLISSGGTARTLQEAGIPVTPVGQHTGAPEMLGGRVKTLHPRVHGGILAQLDLEQDRIDLAQQGIPPIELVVVNLYPFERTVAQPGVTLAEAIEKIDIGGPTLVRAAAKNYAHVTVLTDPSQYQPYLQELASHSSPRLSFRWQCSRQAFSRILDYDRAIAAYLDAQPDPDTHAPAAPSPLPDRLTVHGIPKQTLRYGENPHQAARWYRDPGVEQGWSSAVQWQGKELSFNNLVDLEAARAIAAEFVAGQQAAAVVIKHTNPCGVALGETLAQAYERALAADSVSAFGGIVALTQPLDAATATQLTQTFLECVVAPGLDAAAAEILQTKKNLRVLTLADLCVGPALSLRPIAGGILAQQADDHPSDPSAWTAVTERIPSPEEQSELAFAWRVCKHVKSNAIVISHHHQTLGIGAGQMNRVGSVKIALEQAGEKARGAVLASDGFFPFGDSVELMAAAGIAAIIQPGGSLRDQDSTDVANRHQLAMLHTGLRHFLH
ncbi:MAG: bifunctional phosphoribosylaminoimidazolecarboxamide formyltransferase/IMP cyclohydrolase [Synechococcaceae cyanobacterium SM2_3_2]|nr:bifunctional phosphoribosylaminoimidazolecarboxamide formyltransferase/IMP cyclohydrolase [Synechococcaceae cyanobacterium SM2_3_2]